MRLCLFIARNFFDETRSTIVPWIRLTWFLLLQEASQMQNLWKKCSLGVGPSDWFIWLWLVPIKMGRPPLQFLAPKRCGLFWKSLRCRRRNNGERLKFLPNAKKSWQPVIIGKLLLCSLTSIKHEHLYDFLHIQTYGPLFIIIVKIIKWL